MGAPYHVLGIDPGFASIGFALVEILPEGERVVEVRVVHTDKSDKKRKVRASDDNLRRAQEIYRCFDEILHVGVRAICAESMSFPRHATNAAKVAMCWGVLASQAAAKGLPVLQASPQEIKKTLTGVRSASKEAVQEALRARYPRQLDTFHAKSRKGDLEHGYDAVGAVVACLDSDVIHLLRRLLE